MTWPVSSLRVISHIGSVKAFRAYLRAVWCLSALVNWRDLTWKISYCGTG